MRGAQLCDDTADGGILLRKPLGKWLVNVLKPCICVFIYIYIHVCVFACVCVHIEIDRY